MNDKESPVSLKAHNNLKYDKLVQRNSSIELLRIFAMTSILLCHFFMGISTYVQTISDSVFYYFHLFFSGWTGAFGNILFMLISGYYLCTSNFRISKLIKLWFNIFSVSVIIGSVFYFFKHPSQGFNFFKSSFFFNNATPISLYQYLTCFIPTILGHTWYASRYLVFLLFTPFCKQILEKLSQKQHFYLCLLMFILGTVTKMIPAQRLYDPSNLFYFFLAYFIASYIRFYEPSIFSNKALNLLISLITIMVIGFWNIFLTLFINNHPELAEYKRFFHLTKIHMFPVWIAAVFLFNYFRLLTIKNSKIINAFASSTFDIYLLHCNFAFSSMLWFGICSGGYLLKLPTHFLVLLVIPQVFIFGLIFHKIRLKFVEKPFFLFVSKYNVNLH